MGILRIALVASSLTLAACTQDFNVFLPDATADATTDAAKDAASDTAPPGDGGFTFQCGATTVSDCAQCNGMPQPCVYCSTANASTLGGLCTTTGSSCFQAVPNGFSLCTCGNAPSACPENYQVCRNGGCRTCTDSQNNAGFSCHGGGVCSPDGGCK